ncbi:hypothetical protein SGRIM119S_02989 [Streptomyces griseorubiginosus]
MSASHSRFAEWAVKLQRTKSSCTGGLAFFPLARYLPNTLLQRLSRQIRQAVRSAITAPAPRASSAGKR